MYLEWEKVSTPGNTRNYLYKLIENIISGKKNRLFTFHTSVVSCWFVIFALWDGHKPKQMLLQSYKI